MDVTHWSRYDQKATYANYNIMATLPMTSKIIKNGYKMIIKVWRIHRFSQEVQVKYYKRLH